ncbi:MAG: eukaryotic-like serine/threonine-protein kinase [Solirubrobacteraceae bacterium]|nr:eukaryotic-like serine/threonine-protein kinase [Solirubrobacteraceae bacterium]
MRSVRILFLSLFAVLALSATARASVTLDPTGGPPGTFVTATGSGWSATHTVTGPAGTDAQPQPVDAAGGFTMTFHIPDSAGTGLQQYKFTDSTGNLAYFEIANFTVAPPPSGGGGTTCPPNPVVTLSPSSGPLNTTFSVFGDGWMQGGVVKGELPYGSPGWFTGWQAPTADISGVFTVEAKVDTGPGGPTPPGDYIFTWSENQGGCSLSATATFTVTPSGPAMPTGLTATPIDSSTTRLEWSDNANDETSYEVDNGNFSVPLGPDSVGYDWGGQAAGNYQCYRVRAVNAVGPSPWFPDVQPFYVCATTPQPPTDTTAPAVPTNLQIQQACVGGKPTVHLTWDRNVEPDFSQYRVEKVIGGRWETVWQDGSTQASPTYTDDGSSTGGLAAGTLYYYQVKAVDNAAPAGGNVSEGRPANVTVRGCGGSSGGPGAPANGGNNSGGNNSPGGNKPPAPGGNNPPAGSNTPGSNSTGRPTFVCLTGGTCDTTTATTSAQLAPVPSLTHSVAMSRASSILAKRFGRVYTRGNHKHLNCRRQSSSRHSCSVSWRYKKYRYKGRVTVNRNGLVSIQVMRRRV